MIKPIDPSPTPWDFSTWGFYCDKCETFFDLLKDGKVAQTPDEKAYITYWHNCGKEARYISYVK